MAPLDFGLADGLGTVGLRRAPTFRLRARAAATGSAAVFQWHPRCLWRFYRSFGPCGQALHRGHELHLEWPPGRETGILDEQFIYSDGSRERRVWTLQRTAEGRYVGTAADVVGQALGEEGGNAFRFGYTLRLPVDGRTFEVQFDDWMYLMDERVMLNKAVMSKFGIRLGEVTLSFVKR